MKILVIGGAGHIGANLIERLLKEEFVTSVCSLDNYSNGSEANHIDGAEYHVGEASHIEKIVDWQVDLVVHLGEFSRVEQSFNHFSKVVETNIIGSLRVVEFCIKNGCKLVYSASSAISSMGEPGIVNAPYTITKSANVQLIQSIAATHTLNFAIVYFYNVFGPREKGSGENATVVEKFLQKKAEGEQATINFPGTQKRNFTHVFDIVDGIILVMQNGTGDGYAIGNPQAYSVIELAEMIGLDYQIGEAKLGNRQQSSMDLKKIRSLGWEPRHQLIDYIEQRSSQNGSAEFC